MSTVMTMSGKLGDSLMQWPVVFHWFKTTGGTCELWLDEKTCAPLVPLYESQPGVSAVKLIGGIQNWSCGGQPFHFELPASAYDGHTIYHLGLRSFPIRQLSLQCLQDSKVPVQVDTEAFAETPTLAVQSATPVNRLVLHGQGICGHTRSTPQFWKFLAGVREELESLFDEIVFVGSEDDREVALATYPMWTAFDDGGNFLKLAEYVAGSRAMIGCGSSPIVIAGCLKVPAIRVHDDIGGAPRVIWNNLGANQINETEIGLRIEWPKFRDRWLTKTVDVESVRP